MGIFRKPASAKQLETSLAIELDEGDLLDIDGSDDQTMAFADRAAKRRLARAMKDLRPAAVRASVQEAEDLRLTNPIERQAEFYPEPPTLLAADIRLPLDPTLSRTPPTPAHFWRPSPRVPTESGVSESYPPVAVMTEAQAELKLGGSRPSRLGWVAAAVIGTMLLIGASLRAAPQVDSAPSSAAAPPAAVAEVPKPAANDDAKVVKFDDAVAITRATPRPAPHRAWTAPWKKPKVEEKKIEKAEKAEKPAPPPASAKTAEQRELEALQLKAAER